MTGKVCIVPTVLPFEEAMINEHVFIIRGNEKKALQQYLCAFLFSELGQELLKNNITGQAQGGLNSTNLKSIKIPLPPLDIQKKIVEEISKVDEEYNTTRMTIETYRNKIENIFNDMEIIGKQGGASLTRLEELYSSLEYGFTATARESGDVRFVRITDIDPNGDLYKENAKYIDLTNEAKKYSLNKNDILVARTGNTYAKTTMFNEDYQAVFASYLIRINLIADKLLSKYYWKYAQTRHYWQQAESLVSGMAQPQFNANAIQQLKIPLPPLEKQKEIVAEIEQYEKQITEAQCKLNELKHSKKDILKKYLD